MIEENFTLVTPTLTGICETIKTKVQFVAAASDCDVLNTNIRGLIEISGLFFKACNSPKITSAFKDSNGEYTWGSYFDACTRLVDSEILSGEGPNSWISPKGNIICCSWGSHTSICDSLMYLEECWVEKIWLKVSSCRDQGRPIPYDQFMTHGMTNRQETAYLEILNKYETT